MYNPRRQEWGEHFRWDDTVLVGITAIGRATIHTLRMNRPVIIAIRAEEKYFGRHPRSGERDNDTLRE